MLFASARLGSGAGSHCRFVAEGGLTAAVLLLSLATQRRKSADEPRNS